MNKEIVVIGGGPGGIEAAREAANLGMKVTMVSAGPVGGRAGPRGRVVAGGGEGDRHGVGGAAHAAYIDLGETGETKNGYAKALVCAAKKIISLCPLVH